MIDFHAWHMSDNTIQLWSVGNDAEYIVTWNIHPYYMNFTSYKLNGIDPTSSPYPRVSWIAANNEEVIRFQCGPAANCYPTIKDPVPIPIKPNFYVQAIRNINYGDDMSLLLVHPGGAIRVQETNTDLYVVDSLDWSSQSWFQTFPVNRINGAVRTYVNHNNQARGRLTVAISPQSNVTGVGLIVNAVYDSIGRRLKQVTMMPQAAQNFAAHEKNTGDGLVYYWLMQTPYVDTATKNAYVLSHGGGSQNAPQYASTTFKPGVHWSREVFLFDKGELMGTLDIGMLVSGNEAQSGFNVWSPQFAFGQASPEVVLGNSRPVTSFGMPILADNLFGDHLGSAASMATKGPDGCWWYVILDWNANSPGKRLALDAFRQRSTEMYKEIRANPHRNYTKDAVTQRIEKAQAAQEQQVLQGQGANNAMKSANDFSKILSDPLKTSTSAKRESTMGQFSANCRVSNCDIDNPGDCPIGQCWARGAIGGFQCCEHPPV